jgi:hypothetical protein
VELLYTEDTAVFRFEMFDDAEDLLKWRSRHRDYVKDFVDYLREISHSE